MTDWIPPNIHPTHGTEQIASYIKKIFPKVLMIPTPIRLKYYKQRWFDGFRVGVVGAGQYKTKVV
jgi:hypothetical protein